MDYRTCPDCGSALDPGERCDCQLDELAAYLWEKQEAAPDD